MRQQRLNRHLCVIRMRVQRSKNSARPPLKEEDAPNLSTKNFLNKPVNDAESLRSRQPTHILKVLGDGGPGEGAFIRKSPSPVAPTDARVGYTGSPRVLLCAKAGLGVRL